LPKRARFLFFLVLALLKLNPVAGVTGFFDNAGRIKSMGIHCALSHSPLDDSFAPGMAGIWMAGRIAT
jgi:hypothetical protein